MSESVTTAASLGLKRGKGDLCVFDKAVTKEMVVKAKASSGHSSAIQYSPENSEGHIYSVARGKLLGRPGDI